MTDSGRARLASEEDSEWLNGPLPQGPPTPSLLADEELRSFLLAQEDAGRGPHRAEVDEEAVTLRSVATSLETGQELDEPCGSNRSGGNVRSGPKEARTTVTSRPIARSWKAWLLEILSFLAAVSCLATIATILGRYNGQLQPEWPHSLNLTTLVALLATILRSMLMQVVESVLGQLKWSWYRSARSLHHLGTFDGATRGPWGSLKLLFLIPRFNWATFAAVITTVSVGIGAFTQQSLQTYPCPRPVPGNTAFIPIARTTKGGYTEMATAFSAAGYRLLDPGMKSALMLGLAGTKGSLPISCPTGNCTFQDFDGVTYSTLGFNSQCIDSTPWLTQTGSSSWSRGEFMESKLDGANLSSWTNYSLPQSPLITLGYSLLSYSTFRHWGRWQPMIRVGKGFTGIPAEESKEWERVKNSTAVALSFLVPVSNPCQQETLSLFDQENRGCGDVDPDPPLDPGVCPQLNFNNITSLPGNWSVMATSCYLYPSLRSYRGSIENGRLEEQLVGDPVPLTFDLKGATNASYYGFQDPCVIDGKYYTKTNLSSAPGKPFEMSNPDGSPSVGADTGPQQCAYWLPIYWQEALQETLGSQIASPAENDCFVTDQYTDTSCSDKWWLPRVYNNRNASLESIRQVMDDVAESLTIQLRTIGAEIDGTPSRAYGTAYQTEVCTRFVWQWLFFPGAVTLATALVLLSVTVPSRSGSTSAMPWKTSIFPLIFYGLSRDTGRGMVIDDLLSEEELSSIAKDYKVNFTKQDDGWSFHSVQ